MGAGRFSMLAMPSSSHLSRYTLCRFRIAIWPLHAAKTMTKNSAATRSRMMSRSLLSKRRVALKLGGDPSISRKTGEQKPAFHRVRT